MNMYFTCMNHIHTQTVGRDLNEIMNKSTQTVGQDLDEIMNHIHIDSWTRFGRD